MKRSLSVDSENNQINWVWYRVEDRFALQSAGRSDKHQLTSAGTEEVSLAVKHNKHGSDPKTNLSFSIGRWNGAKSPKIKAEMCGPLWGLGQGCVGLIQFYCILLGAEDLDAGVENLNKKQKNPHKFCFDYLSS